MDFSIDEHPEGAVFWIRRPQKLNAVTKSVWDGLEACLDTLETRRARFLIVTAGGERAFCAGTDLSEARVLTVEQNNEKNDRVRALLLRLSRSQLITVAAINGLAYGGGLELAMACMLRIAGPDVKMSMPEVKLGVLPTYGGTQSLTALVGSGRALDLMLTGRSIGVQEAMAIGLINRIATTNRSVLDQALDYVREITSFSPVAVSAIRRCVAAAGPVVTEAGLAAEGREARLVLQSEDSKEGIAAFLQKRPPVFKGR